MRHNILILSLAAVATLWGQQQTDQRSAEIRGGGGDGRCTLELEVDNTVEVSLNDQMASVYTMNGQPSRIRSFECNHPMSANPTGFRFKKEDGRGDARLVRSPAGGNPAVIRITDSKGGADRYRLSINWDDGGSYGGNNREPTTSNNLNDLVGISARAGESELQQRNYRMVRNEVQGQARMNYWQRGRECVAVEVFDGKYSFLNRVDSDECNGGGNTDAAPREPQDASDVSDLTGARASAGEKELERRGYRLIRNEVQGQARINYWLKGLECIAVEVFDGKYSYLNRVPNGNCHN